MFKATELPIVGGVIQAVITYIKVTFAIIFHPFSFPNKIDYNEKIELKKAIEYVLASIAIDYIILIPLLVKFEQDISSNIFIISKFIDYFIIFLCIFVIFKILGSNKGARVTIILQSYLTGFFVPLTTVIGLFSLSKLGPELTFGVLHPNSSDMDELTKQIAVAMQHSIVITTLAIMNVIFVLSMFLTVSWLATGYQVSKKRAFVGFLIGTVGGLMLLEYMWYPLWRYIDEYLISFLKYV